MPRPFDLEKAKAGAPLVTRTGIPARFVAHVPDAEKTSKVVAKIADRGSCSCHQENGVCYLGQFKDSDLFLADPPKVKKERWVAVYRLGTEFHQVSDAVKREVEEFLQDNPSRKLCGEIIHHTWEEDAP